MIRCRSLLAAALLLAPLAPALAQSGGVPYLNMPIGTRLRVVPLDSARMATGEFSHVRADSLVLRRPVSTDTAVAFRDLLRIDEAVKPFNTPATRQGAIIGGAIGLVAGIFIADKQARDCRTNSTTEFRDLCGIVYTNITQFAAIGGGLGFGIAWLGSDETWQVRWRATPPR